MYAKINFATSHVIETLNFKCLVFLVMASVSTLMDDINLVGEQIFDHTVLIRNQINKFIDNFEGNERHKEFDGIIRVSHSV